MSVVRTATKWGEKEKNALNNLNRVFLIQYHRIVSKTLNTIEIVTTVPRAWKVVKKDNVLFVKDINNQNS